MSKEFFSSETMQWGWREKHNERARGPFNSRKEALDDVYRTYNRLDRVTIILGYVRWADPGACVYDDLDNILERMEENAYDSEFGWYEDQVFELSEKDTNKAQIELTEFMQKWARKWLQPNCWVLDEVETYEVPPV